MIRVRDNSKDRVTVSNEQCRLRNVVKDEAQSIPR